MVKVKLFKDNHDYKDDVFVAVNGERHLIQRGVEVEVPDYIAEYWNIPPSRMPAQRSSSKKTRRTTRNRVQSENIKQGSRERTSQAFCYSGGGRDGG